MGQCPHLFGTLQLLFEFSLLFGGLLQFGDVVDGGQDGAFTAEGDGAGVDFHLDAAPVPPQIAQTVDSLPTLFGAAPPAFQDGTVLRVDEDQHIRADNLVPGVEAMQTQPG